MPANTKLAAQLIVLMLALILLIAGQLWMALIMLLISFIPLTKLIANFNRPVEQEPFKEPFVEKPIPFMETNQRPKTLPEE